MKTLAALAMLAASTLTAQMNHKPAGEMKTDSMQEMHHAPAKRSEMLKLTGLDGKKVSLSPADFAKMPHVTLNVHNGHSDKDETYSGVPVSELLKLVTAAGKPKVSPRMTVLVFSATDNFHVVLTSCDTDPGCHNGQVIVADSMDNKPLEDVGAFKLVVSEDKKPGRWARNLDSITVKAVE